MAPTPTQSKSEVRTVKWWVEILILPAVLLVLGTVWTTNIENDLTNRSNKLELTLAKSQEVLENVRWLRSLSGDITHERLFQGMNLHEAQAGGLHLGCIDDSGKKTERACPDLSRADLSGSELFHASLSGGFFDDTDLAQADLSVTDLRGVTIFDSNFSHAWAQQAVFDNAEIHGANFTGANLACSSMQGASFENVKLVDADIQCVNFSKASFDDVDLTGVCFNSKTVFPKGVARPAHSDKAHCRRNI